MANNDFYSKGTIKIKNADGISVPFMPNTDISNVKNSDVPFSQTISNLNTRISDAATKGGIKVMYEMPDESNTLTYAPKTLIGYIDPYIKAKDDEWYITVKTSNKKAAIPFQLYNQPEITLSVNWGDDTQSTLTPADYTNDGTNNGSIHTYANDGVYTIKIVSSDWSNTQIASAFSVSSNTYSTGTSSSSSYINTTYYNFLNIFRSTLYQVNSEIPSFKGIIYKSSDGGSWYSRANAAMGIFAYCSKLIYIPPDIFKYNKTKTNYNGCFCGCSALKEIPKDIFKGCNAGQYFDYVFADCTSITAIPPHLFDDCINAEYFDSVFASTRITAIPAGLFNYNTKAISFSKAFSNTNIIEIPAHLFDNTKGYCYVQTFYRTSITSIPAGLFNHRGSRFDACFSGTQITSIPSLLFEDCNCQVFWQVFQYCSKLTTIPEQLFKNCTSLDTFDYAFANCYSLTTIPEDLFEGTAGADRTPYMFYYCSKLTEIPEHLFDNTVGSTYTWMDHMFEECRSLTSLPEHLFDNAVKSSYSSESGNITLNSMFAGCYNLTTIPSGLFNNKLGKRLSGVTKCFYYTGLTSIPEDTFRGCSRITSFEDTFNGCKLQSIPSGLFDDCPNVTSFKNCFANNHPQYYVSEYLNQIPEHLFDVCTKVTNFYGCFWNVTGLQSIPEDLFKYNVNVENFDICFFDNIMGAEPTNFTIDFTLHIGSTKVSSAERFVKNRTAARTIYVPSGSTTEATFNAVASNLGLTIIGE